MSICYFVLSERNQSQKAILCVHARKVPRTGNPREGADQQLLG